MTSEPGSTIPPASASGPDVCVVIVNWNSAAMTADALETLRQHTEGVSYEVVVVENHSTRDDSRDLLPARFPWARVVLNPENVGFSRANNQAIRLVAARYYLLLNPDTLQTENAIGRAVAYMDARPEVGALGIKHIEHRTGAVQASAYRFTSVWYHTLELFRLQFLARPTPPVDHGAEQDVGWLVGSFLMVRRECLEQVGTLDEAFFLNNEDADWCRRANRAGWKVRYWPGASFRHIGCGTRHFMGDLGFTAVRSNLTYAWRNDSPLAAAAYFSAITLLMAWGSARGIAEWAVGIRPWATVAPKIRRLLMFVTLRSARYGC